MRIFLIGYMGCGKTHWGKELAQALNLNFVDLDALIEEQQGMSISQIFDELGEVEFREREHSALVSLQDRENVVIATGGGAPCYNNNMEWMNQNGRTIFLNLEIEELADRIQKSQDDRPLVRNKSREELLTYIERHLQLRLPFYLQAQHILTGEQQTVQGLLDAVNAE